jgi:hypothetical protein
MEQKRIDERNKGKKAWHKWGAYLQERAWGTVREDYSADGNAWDYFPFDQAHKKAFRWGEDGIFGICDQYELLCFAFAFWNEKDPILKERYFGLSNPQGNHGEDVKELYYYLEATPTHSYLKLLYKYPQNLFPYKELIEVNKQRGLKEREYEIWDTDAFKNDAYFNIEMELAKIDVEDLAIRITIENKAKQQAPLHLLPTLWFRNRWSWKEKNIGKPKITKKEEGLFFADYTNGPDVHYLDWDYHTPNMYFYGPDTQMLFTENETGKKELIGAHLIEQKPLDTDEGTKASFHYALQFGPQEKKCFYFRLSSKYLEKPLKGLDSIFKERIKETDAFYEALLRQNASEEDRRIQRQAFASLNFSKQFYYYRINTWLNGDDAKHPPPACRAGGRNEHWRHMFAKTIMLVCDKWEYPWPAAWDFAFHCVAMSKIDLQFAKDQLWILYSNRFLHPSGQVPAYEWNFSDLNPPLLPWCAWRLYKQGKRVGADKKENRPFLEKCFHKALLEFSWWVNVIDREGDNVFEGGFLGLDNITVVDRDKELEKGGLIEQSDGTGWMGMMCIVMTRIALELAKENPVYEDLAMKFFEHFFYIKEALQFPPNKEMGLWSEEDGIFYDLIKYPDGNFEQIKVRSIVGIIPMFGVDYITQEDLDVLPQFKKHFEWFLKVRKEQSQKVLTQVEKDGKPCYLLSLVNLEELKRLIGHLGNESQFLSPFGIRSLSKHHEKNSFKCLENEIRYVPGESEHRIKGGNSNWRGPVWLCMNFLIIEALRILDSALGSTFKAPFGNQEDQTLYQMAHTIKERLATLFRKNSDQKRPMYNEYDLLQSTDFQDHLLFFEHFHPDTGRGLGANHQTGWTALIAALLQEWD